MILILLLVWLYSPPKITSDDQSWRQRIQEERDNRANEAGNESFRRIDQKYGEK